MYELKEEIIKIIEQAGDIPAKNFDIAIVRATLEKKLNKFVTMQEVLNTLEELAREGIIDKENDRYVFKEEYSKTMIKNNIITILQRLNEVKVSTLINWFKVNKKYKYSDSFIYKIVKELENEGLIEVVSKRPKIIKLKNIKMKKRKI